MFGSHIWAVSLGGVLGALARYAVYHGMRLYVPVGYPALATLVVNTLGCAAMGGLCGTDFVKNERSLFSDCGVFGELYDIFNLYGGCFLDGAKPIDG